MVSAAPVLHGHPIGQQPRPRASSLPSCLPYCPPPPAQQQFQPFEVLHDVIPTI